MQVNLRYGLRHGVARTGHERDTCTSCAGTMILEFAALSRLSGESIFEVNIPFHKRIGAVGKVIEYHRNLIYKKFFTWHLSVSITV